MKMLKFLGHIIRKEGMEKLILTRQIEGKKERRKQCITYLARLSKWMEEQGLGEITKNTKFIKTYKEQEIVESHDRLCPEGTRHIKKKNLVDPLHE